MDHTDILAEMAGFEPTLAGVKVRCLTAWLHPCVKVGSFGHAQDLNKKREEVLLPGAVDRYRTGVPSLEGWCATIAPHRQMPVFPGCQQKRS